MNLKRIFAAAAVIAALPICAYADGNIQVTYNGKSVAFNERPIIVRDKTLVQLRPIAEAMGLEIGFSEENGNIILSNDKTTVVFTENSDKIQVNDTVVYMGVPATIRNNYTFVPVREIAEPFGKNVSYDEKTKTVIIDEGSAENNTDEVKKNEIKQISIGSGKYSSTFYYQSQPDLELENRGRGYCWVCSYAMLISDAKGEAVTPIDVANINIKKGYNGNFMSGHSTLVAEFGCELVPALSEQSQYYAGFNTKNRGETTLNITSAQDARGALREALKNSPYGVIVRYEGYPHSMIAVACDDEYIYFNDPGLPSGEHVKFEDTCLKNFKIEDISYIQAIKVKN